MAIYENSELIDFVKVKSLLDDESQELKSKYAIDGVCYSSVRKDSLNEISEFFPNLPISSISYKSKLPFTLQYDTPETLGLDRIAAALGAFKHYPNDNCLIIDTGTCLTLDLLSPELGFAGGNISPGWDLRIKAMHEFTAKLPLVSRRKHSTLLGKNTHMAMENGALYGIIFEISGYIQHLLKQFETLKVLFTGGNSNDFAELIETEIFVHPYLILDGLNYLYELEK